MFRSLKRKSRSKSPQRKIHAVLDGEPLPHWQHDANEVIIQISAEDLTISKVKKEAHDTRYWKKHLSAREYRVLRKKKREPAFSHPYTHHYPMSGYYACRGCGNPLYSYHVSLFICFYYFYPWINRLIIHQLFVVRQSKFDCESGWPTFGQAVEGSLEAEQEKKSKSIRILCHKCKGHIGDVFDERNVFFEERHCVNGSSIKYVDNPLPRRTNYKATVLLPKHRDVSLPSHIRYKKVPRDDVSSLAAGTARRWPHSILLARV